MPKSTGPIDLPSGVQDGDIRLPPSHEGKSSSLHPTQSRHNAEFRGKIRIFHRGANLLFGQIFRETA